MAYHTALLSLPGGKDLSQELKTALVMEPGEFEARWAAD